MKETDSTSSMFPARCNVHGGWTVCCRGVLYHTVKYFTGINIYMIKVAFHNIEDTADTTTVCKDCWTSRARECFYVNVDRQWTQTY